MCVFGAGRVGEEAGGLGVFPPPVPRPWGSVGQGEAPEA